MSRRPTPRKKRHVPVILYLLWPLWGPVVLWAKSARKKKAKAKEVTKTDLAVALKAVKTGKTEELEKITQAATAKGWHYQNRHVVDAALVAVLLALSKVLLLAPSVLNLPALLIAGVSLVGAVAWLRKVSASPLPEVKKKVLDRVPSTAPLKLRKALAWLSSPAFGAAVVITLAAFWWITPLARPRAILLWLVITGVTLAVRAWRFRVRPYEVTTTGTREGDWEAFVAVKEPAKGSVLEGTTEFFRTGTEQRLGWTGGVVLPQGSRGATAVAPALTGPTATTYGVGVEDVMMERREKPEGGFDERRFVVTVLDEPGSNAVWATHEYDGSDFDPVAGTWTQAIRADWKPATLQLYAPEVGGLSIHFSGETGGGKSEGMETALRSITSRGVVAPWIIDIGAATFGDWRDRVEIFVDNMADAAQLLQNHEAARTLRKVKRGKMRQIVDGRDVGQRRIYPVDREHPALVGIFDEWSFALDDRDFGKLIMVTTQATVTQQRKEVMPLIVAGQATSLKFGFLNNSTIRTQFQGGGMVAFKNNAESGRQVFGKNIQVDPSTLPLAFKGACFLTSYADARDAMARGRWVRRPSDWDHQIDIPPIPADEVDLLTRGLSFRPHMTQVPEMPAQRSPEPAAEPVKLHAVPKAKPTLADEVAEWVIQQERAVQRQEVVEEFARRCRANSRGVDKALKEAKDAELLVADGKGFYTSAKEVAS